MCGPGSYDTRPVRDLGLCGVVTGGHTGHLEVFEIALDTYTGATEMSPRFAWGITGA